MAGHEVEIRRRIGGSLDVIEAGVSDGVVHRVPEWMTQQAVCGAMRVEEAPAVSVGALQQVRALIDSWRAQTPAQVSGRDLRGDVDAPHMAP